MKITDQDRKTAKEKKKPSRPMTAEAADRLREIAAHDKAAKAADQQFVSTFASLPRDTLTFVELLRRMSTDHTNLHRRANKLRLALKNGCTIGTAHDVLFVSELNESEIRITDERFVGWIGEEWPSTEEEPKPVKTGLCQVCKGKLVARQTVICSKSGCRATLERKRACLRLQTLLTKANVYAGSAST